MTTLAYDGKTLAADRQLTLGGTPMPLRKIFRHNDELIGLSGSVQESLLFLEWYRNGGVSAGDKPKLSDDFSALVITDGKIMRYEALLMPWQIDLPFWAAGSGADYALGAMAAGKSAVEAVEIAIRFDTSSGMGIDYVDLEGGGLIM